MNKEHTRYFLRVGKRPWDECTQKEFREAEWSAGFRGATAGFSNGSLSGTTMNHQVRFFWEDGIRLLTPLSLLIEESFDVQVLGVFFDSGAELSESVWNNHDTCIRADIRRLRTTQEMLENGTLVLTDPTPKQASRSILQKNLALGEKVMLRNLENRTTYREIREKYKR